jgi:hypothetical protein
MATEENLAQVGAESFSDVQAVVVPESTEVSPILPSTLLQEDTFEEEHLKDTSDEEHLIASIHDPHVVAAATAAHHAEEVAHRANVAAEETATLQEAKVQAAAKHAAIVITAENAKASVAEEAAMVAGAKEREAYQKNVQEQLRRNAEEVARQASIAAATVAGTSPSSSHPTANALLQQATGSGTVVGGIDHPCAPVCPIGICDDEADMSKAECIACKSCQTLSGRAQKQGVTSIGRAVGQAGHYIVGLLGTSNAAGSGAADPCAFVCQGPQGPCDAQSPLARCQPCKSCHALPHQQQVVVTKMGKTVGSGPHKITPARAAKNKLTKAKKKAKKAKKQLKAAKGKRAKKRALKKLTKAMKKVHKAVAVHKKAAAVVRKMHWKAAKALEEARAKKKVDGDGKRFTPCKNGIGSCH